MKRIVIALVCLLISTSGFLKAQPKIIWLKGTGLGANDIAFSPDSTKMAVTDYEKITIRDTKTATILRSITLPFEKLTTYFYSIDWSHEGNFLAAAATNDSLYYIDFQTGEVIKQFYNYGSVELSPNSTYILDRNTLKRSPFNYYTRKVYKTNDMTSVILPFEFDDIIILPGDSTAVVTYKDSVIMRRFPTGEIIRHFEYYRNPALANPIAILGENIATVSYDTLIIINIGSGKITGRFQNEHLYRTVLLSFTPDEQKIVTASTFPYPELNLWNVATGEHLLSRSSGGDYGKPLHVPNNDLAYFWSPTAFNPYTMTSGSVMLPWDLKTGDLYRQPHHGHHARIRSLKFANNDENIISYGEDSTEITWNTKTGEMISLKKLTDLDSTTLRKKISEISQFGTYRLGFNDQNGALSLWDNQQNIKLYDFVQIGSRPSYRFLAFTPDEQYSIVCIPNFITFSPELHIWNNLTGEKIYSVGTAIDGIAFAENNRYFAAFDITGGGFIVWSGEDMATSIQSFKTEDFPLTFYPNPLKETSTISCSLPADGLLKITLHDMLGREVAVVHDAFKSAGNYTFPFKRENLPDGMYVLKMSAGGRSLTKSVSIVR